MNASMSWNSSAEQVTQWLNERVDSDELWKKSSDNGGFDNEGVTSFNVD